MHHFHFYLVQLHIIMGAIALIVFWVPIATRKGSKNHLQYGKVYVWLMYGVSISGLITSLMVLIDPIGIRHPGEFLSSSTAYSLATQYRSSSIFLFMLSLLVLMSVRQSVAVLRAKSNRSQLKSTLNLGVALCLGVCGVIVSYLGWTNNQILLTIFGTISIFSSLNFFRYVYKAQIKQREWLIVHLNAVIGSGIGAYTAFFAFGGRYFFSELLPGQLQVIPWVLPALIGSIGTFVSAKIYRAKFKVN